MKYEYNDSTCPKFVTLVTDSLIRMQQETLKLSHEYIESSRPKFVTFVTDSLIRMQQKTPS